MDNLSQRLNTFLLSAEEIRQLNPEWKDQMVQDYLDIFRNLSIIAEGVDSQVDFSGGLESFIFENALMVAKLRSRLNNIEKKPEVIINNGKIRVRVNMQNKRIDDLEQLAHAW